MESSLLTKNCQIAEQISGCLRSLYWSTPPCQDQYHLATAENS
ncbi:MAG: hypothetical protein AAGF83_00175 [Cyanobacteria bacterium P01_G01_bin.67]